LHASFVTAAYGVRLSIDLDPGLRGDVIGDGT
jgi:hypothetical protein